MAEEGLAQIQNEYWAQTHVALLVHKFELPIYTRLQDKKRSTKARRRAGAGKSAEEVPEETDG
jgi:hypothetical protein